MFQSIVMGDEAWWSRKVYIKAARKQRERDAGRGRGEVRFLSNPFPPSI